MSSEAHLLLTVRLHGDGQGTARFHGMARGAPEWPPSPARVFQALVAGVARDGALPEPDAHALAWLERLPPPMIAAPPRQHGQPVSLFVPNNDADSLSDPLDISGIRTKKLVQPSLFAEDEPLLYAWPLPADAAPGKIIVAAATELYQLGRGVDMAWAVAEILDAASLADRIAGYRGTIHRPEPGVAGDCTLACPTTGSLASLLERHHAVRIRTEGTGKGARVLFSNAPKPRFLGVSYSRPRTQMVYQLRNRDDDKPWPWRLGRVVKLVEILRDAAAARLREALPGRAPAIESTLIGRKADGSDAGPIEHRIRIVPLPSIGFAHVDRAIRRFLLDIPSGTPLEPADIEWAFSGIDSETPEVPASLAVVRNDDDDMPRHYLGPHRHWRSVTAVALPERAQRRRIEPTRQREEAKGAIERQAEEARAVAAVLVALRHAGVHAIATAIHVQREPFEGRGARAETFAEDTRFAKERLWHVELELDRQISGPLVIGDGRFLGLGVMAPVPPPAPTLQIIQSPAPHALLSLQVDGDAHDDPLGLARALRRAVMSRVQAELGRQPLDRFFSGHEPDGAKASAPTTNHLAFQWDRPHRRLLVIAPHLLDRRPATRAETDHLTILARALDGFTELRAGRAGRFSVRLTSLAASDPLLAPSRRWATATPYAVTRHAKHSTASDALISDISAQCVATGLPVPTVAVLSARGIPGRGLEGDLQLDFSVAISGPLVLGRTRYIGGGLFLATRES